MIKALNAVEGVGRLVLPPELTLSRWSIVFAPNGGGKSTTSLLFRSLAQGNASLLEEAQVLPGPVAQRVLVTTDAAAPNDTILLEKGSWSRALPSLRVFDARFAYDNLYVGNIVNPDQKAALHRFVLGEDNVALARKVDEIDTDIRLLNDEMGKCEKILAARASPIPVNDFLMFVPDPQLDTKEMALKDKINVAERVAQLRAQSLFRVPPPISFDLAGVDSLLSRTVAGMAEDSLRLAMDRSTALGPQGGAWIARGLAFAPSLTDPCPFCLARIDENALVSAFRQVFTSAYAQLRSDVTATLASVRSLAGGQAGDAARAALDFNEGVAGFWKAEGVSVPNRQLWEEGYGLLALSAKGLIPVLEAKESVPHSAYGNPDVMKQSIEALEAARARFADYEASVTDCNAAIQGRKGLAEAADLQALLRERDLLRAVRERQVPETKSLCDQLLANRKKKGSLTEDKSASKEALEASVGVLMPKLVAGINDFLKLAGADFSLKSITTTYPGGIPRAEYVVSLRKAAVAASKRAGTPHHVGSVLSEGDRSTLAFAFFLTRLNLEPTLKDLVVVVDDPVNSMDSGRRGITCESLMTLAKDCGQFILLSHDGFFLKDFVGRFSPKQAQEISRLQLKKTGEESRVAPWDLDLATRSEFETRYNAVAMYVLKGTGDLLAVATALRPLVEGYLRRRFPGDLGEARMLGSILGMIDTAPAISVLAVAKPDLDELRALNNYARQFHHDDGETPASPAIDEVELKAMATSALQFVNR